MKLKSILFIDIPELEELTGDPEDSILSAKWKAENIISGKEYARHMTNMKYSRSLLSLASYIRKKGFSPSYISATKANKKQLKKKISEVKFIALPASNTPFIPKTIEIARLTKKTNPKAIIIVGGYHATFQDKELLKRNSQIDIVVRGEGEKTLYEILKNYPKINKVRGITFRKNGTSTRNPDRKLLSPHQIPLPAYDLLPENLNNYSMRIQTTRGCPFNCAFCVNHFFWKKVRSVSVKKVIEELLFFKKHLKSTTHVHFTDNNFTLNKERTIRICQEIKRKKIPFKFSCDIRAGHLDKETLKALKKANFTQILIGFEDANNEILEAAEKRTTFEDCTKTAKLIKKNSQIIVTAYWIIGLPHSTRKTFHKTLSQARKLLRKNIVDIVCSALFIPVPGTPIFEKPKKFGVSIISNNWNDYFRCQVPAVYRLKNLNEKELTNYYLAFETAILKEYCRKLKMSPLKIANSPKIQ